MNLTDTQKTIIKILFVEKESSRSILAKKLSLTNAALTLTLKPLLEEKLVLESKNDVPKVGRKELKLSLNKDFGYFLGIEIKRNNVYYTLMDLNCNLIKYVNRNETTIEKFISKYKSKILAIGITMRGSVSLASLKNNHLEIYEDIESLNMPIYISNNVDSLADIYYLMHSEDKNFLLIKYGPGLGSSIYIHGVSLGNKSELGHTYYQDKTVEDTISYQAIINKDVSEEEGTEIILNDEEKFQHVIKVLSFSLMNADSLLSLNKIILSGALLSKDETILKLKSELNSLYNEFDLNKLVVYPDYKDLNIKKGCISAFIKTFE